MSTPFNQLDAGQVKAMLLAMAERVIAAEPALSKADRDLGDGDHGLGMKRGMEAAIEKLNAGSAATVDQAFSAFGMAMMSSMGGASGAIFGTLFRAGGKAIAGAAHLDSKNLAALLQGGLDGVTTRGGAKPGDKTMVDALAAAATAAAASTDKSLPEAFGAVAQAAVEGTLASKAMIAQFGRAKTLGEGCIGFPDAGAISVTIMLRTMRDFVTNGGEDVAKVDDLAWL